MSKKSKHIKKELHNEKHGINRKIQAGLVLGVSLGMTGVATTASADEVVPTIPPITDTTKPIENTNYVDENTVVLPSSTNVSASGEGENVVLPEVELLAEELPSVPRPLESLESTVEESQPETISSENSMNDEVQPSLDSVLEKKESTGDVELNKEVQPKEVVVKEESDSNTPKEIDVEEKPKEIEGGDSPSVESEESVKGESSSTDKQVESGKGDKEESPNTDNNSQEDSTQESEETIHKPTDKEIDSGTSKPIESETPTPPTNPIEENPGKTTPPSEVGKNPDDEKSIENPNNENDLSPSEFKYVLDGKETHFVTGTTLPSFDIADVSTFTFDKSDDVTYKQVTSSGETIDISSGSVLPVPSRVVAVGKYGEVTVATITSNKSYTLDVSYDKESSSLGYHISSDLLEGDSPKQDYLVELDGKLVSNVVFNNGLLGGEITFSNPLGEGSHTLNIRGYSLYGVPILGTILVNIEEVKPVTPSIPNKPDIPTTPTIPSDNEENKPNPIPTPDTERPILPPTNPNVGPSVGGDVTTRPTTPSITNPVIPSGNENPTTIVFPPVNNQNNNQPNRETVVTPPVVKEPPRGISDVSVGGVSIYGEEGVKGVGVVSNRGTTTFTDPSSLDLRVNLDSKLVDSSRTILKLVGRKQGELDSNEFIEMKNGSYRLKGVAKDDFYTLTIKAYDRNGKLVTDTTETFSINRVGSRFNLTNKELAGKSVQSLSDDVYITETNIDKIDTSKTKIRVTRDGKVIEIDKSLVKAKVSGGKDSDWKYTYTINKKAFKKDGVYNIEIFSESESGVKYDSTKRTIQFIVDTKSPIVEVLGIKSKGRYKSSKREILIHVKDISNIKSVKAFLNGKEIKLKYDKDSQAYSYVLESSGEDRNTLVVEATDEAGNMTTETVSDFYLSEDLSFSLLNDNNMYYLFGGLLATSAVFLGYLGFKRKKRLDEEDRLAMEQAILLSESKTSSQQIEDESDSVNVEELLDNQPVADVDNETIPSDIVETEEKTTIPIADDEVTEILEETEVAIGVTEPVTDILDEEYTQTEIIDVEGEEELPTDVIEEIEEDGEYEVTEIIEEDDYEVTDVIEEEDEIK